MPLWTALLALGALRVYKGWHLGVFAEVVADDLARRAHIRLRIPGLQEASGHARLRRDSGVDFEDDGLEQVLKSRGVTLSRVHATREYVDVAVRIRFLGTHHVRLDAAPPPQ